MTTRRLMWGLRSRKSGRLLFASGCSIAPWSFSTREGARAAARECREAKIPVRVVPIEITVKVSQKGVR